MLLKYTVKVLNHFTGFSARNGELYLKYNLSIPKFPVFYFFYFRILFLKLIIELKKIICKTCRS